jgi:hypothetical protein
VSCSIFLIVNLPAGVNLLVGAMPAIIALAAEALGLERENSVPVAGREENRVDLGVNNAAEVTAGLSAGQSISFSGRGVRATFYPDSEGRAAVRVEGRAPEAELRALGEALSKKLIQQYAYHRLVTEMKTRGMNVVEEEVEADGTVRLRVRVFQG